MISYIEPSNGIKEEKEEEEEEESLPSSVESFSSFVSSVVVEDREDDEVEEGSVGEFIFRIDFLFDFDVPVTVPMSMTDFGDVLVINAVVEVVVEEEKEADVIGAQSKSGNIFDRSKIKSNS